MNKCDCCGDLIEGVVHTEYSDGIKLKLCDFCAEPKEDYNYSD